MWPGERANWSSALYLYFVIGTLHFILYTISVARGKGRLVVSLVHGDTTAPRRDTTSVGVGVGNEVVVPVPSRMLDLANLVVVDAVDVRLEQKMLLTTNY